MTLCVMHDLAAKRCRRCQAKATTCRWTVELFDGSYGTTCGRRFDVTTGTPAENGMTYCPYCGHLIAEDAATIRNPEDQP